MTIETKIKTEYKTVFAFNRAFEKKSEFNDALADFIVDAVRQNRRLRIQYKPPHIVYLISWNPEHDDGEITL